MRSLAVDRGPDDAPGLCVPKSRVRPRVDHRHELASMTFNVRNGIGRCGTPSENGSHQTCNWTVAYDPASTPNDRRQGPAAWQAAKPHQDVLSTDGPAVDRPSDTNSATGLSFSPSLQPYLLALTIIGHGTRRNFALSPAGGGTGFPASLGKVTRLVSLWYSPRIGAKSRTKVAESAI